MNDLVEAYIAAWNETDPAARRRLVEQVWTPDSDYVDPMMQANGHDAIEALIIGAQQKFPGLRFRLLGRVDQVADRIRFRWGLGPEGAAPVVEGTDFVVLRDGQMEQVAGFLDVVPA